MLKIVYALFTLFLCMSGCVLPHSKLSEEQQNETNANKEKTYNETKERREKINNALLSLHGTDINLLIPQLGAPTSTYVLPNGNTMYTYTINHLAGPCKEVFTVDTKTGLIIDTALLAASCGMEI